MNFIGRIFGAGRINRPANRDFKPEDLPDTRVRLFFDTLKIRWSSMVGLNLLYLVIWLPAIVWTGINGMAMQQALIEQGEAALSVVGELTMTWLLLLWPLIAVTGPWTAGMSFVLRNLARGEHSFVFSDFWEAVKKNWKQALLVSTVTGVIPFLFYWLFRFYAQMARSVSAAFLIPQGILLLVATAWVLMLEVVYMLMVTYKFTVRQLLKNALVLSVAKLPAFAGVRLLTLALPAAMILSSFYAPGSAIYWWTVGGFFYMVFGFSLNRLLYASLANWVCEEYINPKIGAPTRMGLRPRT